MGYNDFGTYSKSASTPTSVRGSDKFKLPDGEHEVEVRLYFDKEEKGIVGQYLGRLRNDLMLLTGATVKYDLGSEKPSLAIATPAEAKGVGARMAPLAHHAREELLHHNRLNQVSDRKRT